MTAPYPRDMIGYGATPPHAQWPGEARIALQFVINYEEGAENAILLKVDRLCSVVDGTAEFAE